MSKTNAIFQCNIGFLQRNSHTSSYENKSQDFIEINFPSSFDIFRSTINLHDIVSYWDHQLQK